MNKALIVTEIEVIPTVLEKLLGLLICLLRSNSSQYEQIELWEPLKIHRTENRRNLFRHPAPAGASQKPFAEDKLCARIFVASDEKSSHRRACSALSAR